MPSLGKPILWLIEYLIGRNNDSVAKQRKPGNRDLKDGRLLVWSYFTSSSDSRPFAPGPRSELRNTRLSLARDQFPHRATMPGESQLEFLRKNSSIDCDTLDFHGAPFDIVRTGSNTSPSGQESRAVCWLYIQPGYSLLRAIESKKSTLLQSFSVSFSYCMTKGT